MSMFLSTFSERKSKNGKASRFGQRFGMTTSMKDDFDFSNQPKGFKKPLDPLSLALSRFNEALKKHEDVNQQNRDSWIQRAKKLENLRYLNADILAVAFILENKNRDSDVFLPEVFTIKNLKPLLEKIISDPSIFKKKVNLEEELLLLKYRENILRYLKLIVGEKPVHK